MSDNQKIDFLEEKEFGVNSRSSLYNFFFTVVTILCFGYVTLARTLSWDLGFKRGVLVQALLVVYIISSITGFGYAFKSLRKKEKKSTLQKIGVVGNMLFFMMLVVLIITLIVDIGDILLMTNIPEKSKAYKILAYGCLGTFGVIIFLSIFARSY